MKTLEQRLHDALDPRGAVSKRMFGGLGFMLNGNMVAGTFRNGVLFRTGKGFDAIAAARPHARPMEMGGRIAEGYWIVTPDGLDDEGFSFWLEAALVFNASLPAKDPTAKKPMRKVAPGSKA